MFCAKIVKIVFVVVRFVLCRIYFNLIAASLEHYCYILCVLPQFHRCMFVCICLYNHVKLRCGLECVEKISIFVVRFTCRISIYDLYYMQDEYVLFTDLLFGFLNLR